MRRHGSVGRGSVENGRGRAPSKLARLGFEARVAAFVVGALVAGGAPSASDLGLELFTGAPLNLPMPLTVRQSGEPPIHLTAHYATHPFELPFYYAVRAILRSGDRDFALELVHQKLYLSNPPPEIQSFNVSHGYNLVVLTRGFRLAKGLWARAGAGAVIGHPESVVRGRSLGAGGILGSGYYLSGATLAGAIEQRFALVGGLHLVLEGKLTAAYATVPVAGGDATVPSVSLHALVGLGYGGAE